MIVARRFRQLFANECLVLKLDFGPIVDQVYFKFTLQIFFLWCIDFQIQVFKIILLIAEPLNEIGGKSGGILANSRKRRQYAVTRILGDALGILYCFLKCLLIC